MHLLSWIRGGLTGWLVLAIGSGITAATRSGPGTSTATAAQGGLDAAIGGGLLTLVVGGLVLLLGRSYAESVTGRARSEPGRSFLVGFLALLAVIGFFFFGVITRIFIIFAYPLLIAFVLLAIFGTVIAYLAIGRAVTDAWAGALLVAVIVAALIAGIPVIGGLVGLVVGSIGTGAVINRVRDGGSQFQGNSTRTGSPQDW